MFYVSVANVTCNVRFARQVERTGCCGWKAEVEDFGRERGETLGCLATSNLIFCARNALYISPTEEFRNRARIPASRTALRICYGIYQLNMRLMRSCITKTSMCRVPQWPLTVSLMCNAHLYERYDLKTPIHLSRHAIETVWPSFWYLNGDLIWRGILIGTDAFSIINILHGVLVWAKSTHCTVRGFLCDVLIKVQTDVTLLKCIHVFYWTVNMRVSGCRQPCEA